MSSVPVSSSSRLGRFIEWSKTPLPVAQTVAFLLLLSVATTAAWLPPQTRQSLARHLADLPAVHSLVATASSEPTAPNAAPAIQLAAYDRSTREIRPRAVHSFTVTSSADFADASPGNGVCQTSSANGAVCTLRAAIQEANAVSGDDAIGFAATVKGPITLTLGELLVTDSVAITGPGSAKLTVSGNNASRVFRIESGSTSISGLTIRDGRTLGEPLQTPAGTVEGGNGGGIFNQSTLTLDSCIVTNNTVLGGNSGSSSNRYAYGGGIASGGYIPIPSIPATSLTITNSLISNNNAVGGADGGSANGGGIHMAQNSTLSVTNSTISGNTVRGGDSDFSGGSGNGGGISASGDTTVTLSNTTISDNVATGGNDDGDFGATGGYGGGIRAGGKLTLTHCTVTNNEVPFLSGGGPVYAAGGGIGTSAGVNLVLNSTIVAQNRASQYPDVFSTVDSASSFNLIGDGSGANGISNGANNNRVGTGTAPIDAGLDSLRDNGGVVPTNALQSGSPALDGATANGLTTDARGNGFGRTIDLAGITNAGDGSDLGAFEAQSALANKTATSVGLFSSRTPSRAGETVTFTASVIESSSATPTGTLVFRVDGFVVATKPVGSAPATYATNALIKGVHSVRAEYLGDANFRNSSNSLVQTVQDSTACSTVVTNTNDAGDGSLRAAIDCANSNADDSEITFDSGALGTIQLASVLPALSTNITITGPASSQLDVHRNSGGNYGIFRVGAAAGTQPTVSISSITVSNGNATDSGGAIQNAGTLSLRECVFSGNSAPFGGAIANTGTLTAQICTFDGNSATKTSTAGSAQRGGGVFNAGTFTLSDSTFSNNTAGSGGGFFNAAAGTANLVDNTFGINSASGSTLTSNPNSGGGIGNEGTLSLRNCTLSGNSATTGGGIFNARGGKLTIGNTLLDDTAGGSIVNASGTVTDSGYNLARDAGGGVLLASTNKRNTNAALSELRNNGGFTKTFFIQENSPAVDAGNPSSTGLPTYDQRGAPYIRVRAGRVDIGAIEAQTSIPTVTTLVSSLNPSQLGQDVTFTATVAKAPGAFGSDIPTGSVNFYVDGLKVATVTLDAAGKATYTTSSLTRGTRSILATYQNTFTFGGSQSAQLLQSVDSADACSTVVSTTGDSGNGSLRSAIDCANDLTGRQTISFNIPGAGPHTISPTAPLPVIADATTIDGYTQPGATANTLATGTNAQLKIVLYGGDTKRDVDYSGITSAGILNVFGGGSTAGNGTTVRGLVLQNTRYTSVNFLAAAIIFGGTGGHSLEGCFIGTNVQGTTSVAGLDSLAYEPNGISVTSNKNRIGGTSVAARNLISGVVVALNDQGTGTLIQNNMIGTNAAGSASLFTTNGIIVRGTGARIRNNVVASTSPGQGPAGAISITDASDVEVTGNFIGTNAAGTAKLYNSRGVQVYANQSVSNIRIGLPGAGNVIGGGIVYSGGGQGGGQGIYVAAGAQGKVSGVSIQGNFIGTNSAGAKLGNVDGITISSASNVQVGGPNAGEGNVIAYNSGAGVVVRTGAPGSSVNKATANNRITGNSIFENGALGINLLGGTNEATSGLTPNDAGDADTGPNALQNFPVITGVTPTTVSATLNSRPNQTYRVEFFASNGADASGYGEGQTYLGFVNTTTNASGDSPTFTFTLPGNQVGKSISATATDASGNTSEFSLATGVPTTNPTATPRPTGTPRPTATATPRPTATATPRPTGTPTATATPRPTATGTPRPTATATPRPTATATPRPTSTPRPTATPLPTATPAPQLSFSAATTTVAEGNSGTQNAVFSVVLSGTPNSPVSVKYATSNGTATAGSDYTATSGTLTFGVAQGSAKKLRSVTQTILVPIRGDTAREADETFFVTLSDAQGATIGVGRVTATIANDDSAADLSVTQTASASSVPMSTLVTFTLTVRNNGPDSSQGVTLSNIVPNGATFVSSTPVATSQSGNTLTFALGTLASGASRTVLVQVRAPSSVGTLLNSATVAGSGAIDPSAPNNGSSASVVVTAGAPAFSFTLGRVINVGPYSPTMYRPGAHLIQDVTITNTGTAPSSSPLRLVLDGLPSSVTLVGAGGTSAGSPYLVLPNALGVGQSTLVRLEFRMTRSDKPLFSPRIETEAQLR